MLLTWEYISFAEIAVIDPTNLTLQHKVGKGGFGVVWKALLTTTTTGVVKQEEVAVKELRLGTSSNQMELFEDFQREVFIMSCLKHPNVIQLFGITIKPLQMVLEFAACGDLVRTEDTE